jgi:hypothetical protein
MPDFLGILLGLVLIGFAFMFFIVGIGGLTGNLPPPPHFSLVSMVFGEICILISLAICVMGIRVMAGKGPLYD